MAFAAPHWVKVTLAITLPVLGVAIVRSLLLYTPAVKQPVAFDHRTHTERLKIECRLCHQYVATGAHAGLPDGARCAMCHQVRQGTSPEAARLTMLITRGAGDSLRFNKLFHLPPYVYFTHQRHVGIAQLPCQSCHGMIALTQTPPERPLVKIRMQVCLDCHLAKGQSVDCVACHR
ncbi:MAG TPA: cytochrome c3 family protein [Gemmatimonadales bacterium]|nr:cytochrome c3 family protein [Gemmatimonadales bacterium]